MEQGIEVGETWYAKDQSELELEIFDISGDTVSCKLKNDWYGYTKGEVVTYTKSQLVRFYEKQSDVDYKKGYQEGYCCGHTDGKKESLQELQAHHNDLNEEYIKGKTDGYGEGYQHGFTLAKEKITKLDNKEFEGIIDDAFQEGYAQAYSELHAPTSERERQLQEKAWDEGYKEGEADMLETMNELSRQQAEDWNDCREHHEPKKETQESVQEVLDKELALVEKYPHYYKDIRHLNIIDIYRFLSLFGVTDPCLQHAAKKMCVSGKRGSKDYKKDIKEAIDTLNRWEYMQEEDKRIGE